MKKQFIKQLGIHYFINIKEHQEYFTTSICQVNAQGNIEFKNLDHPENEYPLMLFSLRALAILTMNISMSKGMYYCSECRTEHFRDNSMHLFTNKLKDKTRESLQDIQKRKLYL